MNNTTGEKKTNPFKGKLKFRIVFNSPVVLVFAGICLITLILNYITFGWTNEHLFSTYRSGLLNPLTYIRLFTHVLGHRDWSHFIGNMTYILLLGPILEEKYGSKKLILVMLVAGGITGIINNIFFPNVMLCGASGVVFAFILLTSFTGFQEGEIPITFILVAVIFIGQQIVEGITVKDDVSNLAHILGGAVGSAGGYFWNRKAKS